MLNISKTLLDGSCRIDYAQDGVKVLLKQQSLAGKKKLAKLSKWMKQLQKLLQTKDRSAFTVDGVLVKKLFEADDVVKVDEAFAIVETEGGGESTAL